MIYNKILKSYFGQAYKRILSVEGQTLHLSPYQGNEHTHTLIWLHGLGDNSYGFLDAFDNLTYDPCPQTFKIVLPTAPIRPMPSWYNIFDMKTKKCDKEQVEESSERIMKIIEQEIQDLRLKNKDNGYHNIMLGGFSQGAAMSLYTGLVKIQEALAGIICFSGYALESFEDHQIKHPKTPLFIYHGQIDKMVLISHATESYRKQLKNIKYQIKVEEGLEHSVSDKELEDLKEWIKKMYEKAQNEEFSYLQLKFSFN